MATSFMVPRLKLCPPDTTGTIPRKRLQRLVSEARDRRVIICNAQAGSGKSTFVSNFLKDTGTPVIWCNLAPGDSDPVAFFDLIVQGLEEVRGAGVSFPPLTPEYMPSISVYSKKFLKALFSEDANSSKVTLVLDNYQHITEESLVHRVVESFVKGFDAFERLFILSRKPLPFTVIDWDIERSILRLDWSHFRFSPDELMELVQLRVPGTRFTKEEIVSLLNDSGGWIANIIMALRGERWTAGKCRPPFAGDNAWSSEFLALGKDEVSLLARVARLPEITSLHALELTGGEEVVVELLERLACEGFFVAPLQRDTKAYRMHELMRDYLRREARRLMSADEYETHIRSVASLLYKMGYHEEAFKAYYDIGAIGEIYGILSKDCLDWINGGRIFTLKSCLKCLNGSSFANLPWALYSTASLLRFHEPAKALEVFQGALDGFKSEGNKKGIKAVIAEMFDTAQYFGEDFSMTGHLLQEAEGIMDEACDESMGPSVADAMLPAYAGIMYLLHTGDSQRAISCFEKAERFMSRLDGMHIFLSYIYMYAAISYDSAGEILRAEDCFQKASKLFEACPEHPPHRFMFHFLASIHEVFNGRFESSVNRIREFMEYSKDWGLMIHEEHLRIRLLEGLLCQGKTEAAQEVIDGINDLSIRSTFSRAMTLQLVAQRQLMEGDPHGAATAAEESVRLFEGIDARVFAEPSRSLMAVALGEQGEIQEAHAILHGIVEWGRERGNWMQVFTSLMHLAWIDYHSGDVQRAQKFLEEALRLGKKCGFKATYNWYPSMMSALLSLALEKGIEQGYVSSLITAHGLSPNMRVMPSSEGWPWRVKIHTFGGLQVYVDGKRLDLPKWKGKKALELLKVILLLGGEEIQVFTITDILWPDSDGDRAKQNFEFTLRRLRNTLRPKAPSGPVLLLKSGTVGFNRSISWVDTLALNDYLRLAESFTGEGKDSLAAYYMEKALSCYAGKFLETENDPLILTQQAKWHQRVLRVSEGLMRLYDANQDHERLVSLSRKVLEVEPTSTQACHYLVRALTGMGHSLEAVKAFEDFRELIARTKGRSVASQLGPLYESGRDRS